MFIKFTLCANKVKSSPFPELNETLKFKISTYTYEQRNPVASTGTSTAVAGGIPLCHRLFIQSFWKIKIQNLYTKNICFIVQK